MFLEGAKARAAGMAIGEFSEFGDDEMADSYTIGVKESGNAENAEQAEGKTLRGLSVFLLRGLAAQPVPAGQRTSCVATANRRIP